MKNPVVQERIDVLFRYSGQQATLLTVFFRELHKMLNVAKLEWFLLNCYSLMANNSNALHTGK